MPNLGPTALKPAYSLGVVCSSILAARSLKSRWQRIDSRGDAPDRMRGVYRGKISLEYRPWARTRLRSRVKTCTSEPRLWGSFASTSGAATTRQMLLSCSTPGAGRLLQFTPPFRSVLDSIATTDLSQSGHKETRRP